MYSQKPRFSSIFIGHLSDAITIGKGGPGNDGNEVGAQHSQKKTALLKLHHKIV